MHKVLSLIALSSLLSVSAVATPVQAVNGCMTLECVVSYKTYSVPNPTRRGNFISHFDAQGVPQSIVTPSETDVTCTEVQKTSSGQIE